MFGEKVLLQKSERIPSGNAKNEKNEMKNPGIKEDSYLPLFCGFKAIIK